MNMLISRLQLIIISIFVTGTISAQDFSFSQSLGSATYLNPSFAGDAPCARANFFYRNQWPNLSGSFVTTGFGYDMALSKIKSGIGLQFITDNAGKGTIISNQINLLYNYSISINPDFEIRPGIQLGVKSRNIKASKLSFGDMIDPINGFVSPTQETIGDLSESWVNMGTSLLIKWKNLTVGGGAFNILQPNPSNQSPSLVRYLGHASYELNKEKNVSPGIFFKSEFQGDFSTYLAVASLRIKSLRVGVGYRNEDAIISYLGWKVKAFSLAYSYDFTISQLTQYSGGAHEFSLNYFFKCKDKINKYPIGLF